MIKFLFSVMWLMISLTVNCQSKAQPAIGFYDFEDFGHGIPNKMNVFGSEGYVLAVDSIIPKSGNYSMSITSAAGDNDFKALAFNLPGNYNGKLITLSGYMKTENVEGFAGLWMRIDPQIAFDNMESRDIKGTTEWTKYEITLNMNPAKTKQIVVGALMVGTGKIWVDDLHVTIDGKNLSETDTILRKVYPAELDKEFDQGSLVNPIQLDEVKKERLKNLALIWGFLKYYHPNIAAGNYNMDYELFRIIPKVLDAPNNELLNLELIAWVKRFGSFERSDQINLPGDEIKLLPDLAWIDSDAISPELRTLLRRIENGKRPDENYYVGLMPQVRNPSFINENRYAQMDYADTGYRLLALFRYWNIIQYYFPYKNLIGEDWKDVLTEFIPKFIDAKNESEYVMAVWELIGRVHDTHANIWGSNKVVRQYKGTYYAPAEVKFVEGRAIVVDFFTRTGKEETGLQIGDEILEVNGEKVEDIILRRLKYSPASNYATKLRDIGMDLLRTQDSVIQLVYKRDGIVDHKTFKAYSSIDLNKQRDFARDTSFKLLTPDIAYINNGQVKIAHLPAIWEAIKSTKGLIIDNRNYPSEFVIYELSNYLMPEPVPFVKFSRGSVSNPGLFAMEAPMTTGMVNPDYYRGKVVILVNESTQSSAEFHSMSYRVAPGAVVIGSTTAAADGNVSEIYLPGGIRTMISGIGVYYPDGRETQRIGIVPDIEVRPTIAGIRAGKDEVLEKAIELIRAAR